MPTPVNQSRVIPRFPHQRWQLFPAQPEQASEIAQATRLSPLLAQVLLNRGLIDIHAVQSFLDPTTQPLPSPLDEFPDLPISISILHTAILEHQKIAICGDYDADGMTSTALLIRSLRSLGALVDYAIPSRMQEGYGINERIVDEFHQDQVKVLLTVDNGISAMEPIIKARELGLAVIITDHHDLPPLLPPANAILNPKLIPETSPYHTMAGVGVAYILALTLAEHIGQQEQLSQTLLELFTLGTIADLASLTGVNRRWVKQGLQCLPQSTVVGIQALIQVSGVGVNGAEPEAWIAGKEPLHSTSNFSPLSLKPDDIGFRLGPRINAVGRIDDPQLVIELLTTDDRKIAWERAVQCEHINHRRQQLCQEIEQSAIAWCENWHGDIQQERVLVIAQPGWHHGVIGIVASRLVERYGVPVFIGTYEDESQIRGSARGIPEFHVFAALEFCKDLLLKHGGHKAAGGFSLSAHHWDTLRNRLSLFAHQCLEPAHLKPLIQVDCHATLDQLTMDFYHQMNALHPCGIDNKKPIFWTRNVRILEQNKVKGGHLKLKVTDDEGMVQLNAMAWRWGEYCPLPWRIDIAYCLRDNSWQGKSRVELEIQGVRLSS